MIKVLLADDFAIVRLVLRQAIEMQVVTLASNGQEAVDEALLYYPDVAVMDISMPTMDGLEATRQMCAKCPKTRVLMVSSYDTPHYIHRSIEAGASGYILKDNLSHDLVTAIRTLHQGSLFFSKQIAELAKFHVPGVISTTAK